MQFTRIRFNTKVQRGILGALAMGGILFAVGVLSAQDRDHDSDRDRDRMTRIEPGTIIAIRTTDTIDVERSDNQIYRAIVDQEVCGNNGRLAIPVAPALNQSLG
jgi:hypothetical protein